MHRAPIAARLSLLAGAATALSLLLLLGAPGTASAGPDSACTDARSLELASAAIASGMAATSAAEKAERAAVLALLVEGMRAPIKDFHGAMYSIKNQRMWNYADALELELTALDQALAGGDLDAALKSVEMIGGKATQYREQEHCEAP